MPALVKEEEYDTEEEGVTARDKDWLALESDWLEFIGRQPEQRDEIDVVDGDEVLQTFRVVLGNDKRAYRHTDQHRVQIRVHTVEVAPFHE